MTPRNADLDPAPAEVETLLSPDWLIEALDDVEDTEHIVGVEQLAQSQTLAHKVRFSVTFSRSDGSHRTRTYCVKAHFDASVPETLLTEAHVYRDLLPLLDVRAPRAHYTSIDETTGRSLIIMDDVIADGGRFLSTTHPSSVETCRDALAQLARLHAATWEDDRWAVPWLAPRMTTTLDLFSAETLQRLLDDGRGAELPAKLLDANRIRRALVATAAKPPTCVIHGDTHSGNLYLDREGRASWLDWQITQRGHWSIDVSYHLGTVLDVEGRRAHEQELLAAYLKDLDALGVEPPAWEEAWRDYTLGFTWGYFLWVITQISSRAVVLIHMPRLGAALADHDTFRRLGVD